MGLLRFLVRPADRLTAEAATQAYVSGPDLVPWLGHVHYSDGELIVERSIGESGNLHVPWRTSGHGELVLTTSTLMERDEPYVLVVELARGKLNQVRNQLAEWQTIGLGVPRELEPKLRQAHEQFAAAATRQSDPDESSRLAEVALGSALDAADILVRAYTDQALAARRRQHGKLPTHLAVDLGAAPIAEAARKRIVTAFNAAVVSLPWRGIEATEGNYRWEPYDAQLAWCREHALRATAGPLLQLDRAGLPDWLYLWEGDFDNLLSFVSDYVETVVNRYRGQVAAWVCAARVNAGELLGLSEEDRLRLVARSIELARQLDPETPCVLRIDQPWAEFLGRVDLDISPLHFADALIRAGLGLAQIELELSIGYAPTGSPRRDLLDLSRLIDLWACLGVPLSVSIVHPSGERPDPRAGGGPKIHSVGPPGGWSPIAQQRFAERTIALLLAKPAVAAIAWGQLFDGQPHEFPWGGLFDATGQVKPALASIAALRRIHLQ